MRPVRREELSDYVTYDERREGIRRRIIAEKERRRVHVGRYLTFLFENRDTVRYQVQEMMRTERIVREADIQHELDTYNQLLGGPGEIGCTLLIEIADEAERPGLLREWLPLPQHLYVRLADGELVRARFDPAQVGERRLSAVQYLKFDTAGQVPVAIGTDLPALQGETELTADQRAALAEDFQS